MYIYCFTLRNLIKPDTDSLIRVLDVLKKYCSKAHFEYHWEIVFKKNNRHNVHVHGMLKSPHMLTFSLLHEKIPRGFSFHINKCENEQAWTCYMTKSNLTLEQVNKLLVLHIYHVERSESTQKVSQGKIFAEQSVSKDLDLGEDPDELIEGFNQDIIIG